MRLGIDLGGTKTEIIAIDEQGEVLHRERTQTPRNDYDAIVQTVKDLVVQTEAGLGMRGTVGIGIPGTISSSTGLVKNANTVELIGKPFDIHLEKALERRVSIANDADCFTLSESRDGAAKDSSVTFGVILGTGCGGGIVVDNKILHGSNGIGGEWGHNPLPDADAAERPGPACYCGHFGCVETFLSGPGFAADHLRATGDTLSPPEIYQKAVAGERKCAATLNRYMERLAKSLAVVINILDPDIIVLGGGLSNMEILCSNIPKLWGKYVFSDTVETKLVKATHGDSSGVRGAAWLPKSTIGR